MSLCCGNCTNLQNLKKLHPRRLIQSLGNQHTCNSHNDPGERASKFTVKAFTHCHDDVSGKQSCCTFTHSYRSDGYSVWPARLFLKSVRSRSVKYCLQKLDVQQLDNACLLQACSAGKKAYSRSRQHQTGSYHTESRVHNL